ncbi:MAG: hypothetical protein EAZ57_06675 [Cytophagales bacterium]|nr:MAG: hypothetical protein EAZ67_07150 [Cytophagales bacterium]TAF60707.1 MAG: hypothetical protein EAZ57_06675 [Cytophagales bacterium]
MSVFQRMLASIGIGAAKVDTVLEKEELVAGEHVKGYVHLKGGSTDQKIDKVSLFLLAQIPFGTAEEGGRTVYTIAELDVLTVPLTLKAKENQRIDFVFEVPTDTPTSLSQNTQLWFKTSAGIEDALDPTDADHVKIHPNFINSAILTAFKELDFSISGLSYEPRHYRMNTRFPFVQKLEFKPKSRFKEVLSELELVMVSHSTHTELFFELDRKKMGLDLGEKNIKLEITEVQAKQAQELLQTLKDLIEKNIA